MIKDKTLIWDGKALSTEKFAIEEGVQQGTVNSPKLFLIFISDLTRLFNLNSESSNTFALAFADDVIVYTISNKAKTTRDNLENIVNKINNYYSNWNLKLNPEKCETILFRKPLYNLNSKAKAGSAQFKIQTSLPGTNILVDIPHKKTVKYLGVYIDYLLRINKYIDI